MKAKRIRNTEFLKDCIADSLLQLLATKKIETITITEIVSKANVGRATYYRNFETKEAIIVWKLHYLLSTWEYNLPVDLKVDASTYEATVAFMDFFYVHRELFRILYQNRLLHLLLEALYEFASHKNDVVSPFAQAFHIFGMFGIIYEWVRTDMQTTPIELTTIVLRDVFHYETE